MNLLTQLQQLELTERGVRALERIASALEHLAPIAEDTSYDPNEGTVDFTIDPPEESETRKVTEDDLIPSDPDNRY